MKNISYLKICQQVLLIGLVFTIASCGDKFFDEQAGSRITPDQHYKSETDALVSLEGAVMPLQNVLPKLIMVDGLRSDQMDVNPNAEVFLKDINNQVLTIDNPYLDASDYYKVIINVNEVLANIDKVTLTDRNFDPYISHYVKGAMVGLRSWTYLNLLKLYGKAALINGSLTSLPADMNQNIMSKEVLIDTLINQTLPYIFDPLVDKHIEVFVSNHYVNTKAVLGELYLEKGDFANAAKYIKMALESYANSPSMYKVDKAYTKDGWKNIFINAEGAQNENLAIMPYNMNEGQFNPLPKLMLPYDEFMVKPTRLLVDSFNAQLPVKGLPGDVSRGMKISIDTTSAGVPFINKYSLDQSQPFSTDIIISRAADLHLLLAEALNRSGDSKTALILLNAGFSSEKTKPAPYFKWNTNLGIRGRVNLASKVVPDSIRVINGTDTTKVLFTGDDRIKYIEDLIIEERSLELAFEGKRWFDLVRIANRRNDPSYLANKVAAKFAGTSNYDVIRTKLMDPANWYLPFK